MSQDINVLALVKGAERYVFLYDDASRAETLRVLGRYASNPDLSFTWYDAAVLSQKIRQEGNKVGSTRRFDLPLPTEHSSDLSSDLFTDGYPHDGFSPDSDEMV